MNSKRCPDETWWTCTECDCGANYKHRDPPAIRNTTWFCCKCEKIQPFVWEKENYGFCNEGWDYFKCVECGCVYNLPDTEKERHAYRKWQEAGCPPPWWFRPAQLLVLATIM